MQESPSAGKRCCPSNSLRMRFKNVVATICAFLLCFGLVNNGLHLKELANNSDSSGKAVPQNSNSNAQTIIEVPTESVEDIPTTFDGDEVSRITDATSATDDSNTMVWNNDTYKAIQEQGTEFDRRNTQILVDNEMGYIDIDGKLIVDVNETYLFWRGGQGKLCNLLQNMTLATSLNETTRSEILPSAVLNVTMDCIDHNENKQGLGQGNWVTAIYAARMAAFLAGVDFRFQCSDGRTSKMSLLLPWFDKYQAAVTPMNGNGKENGNINTSRWPHGGDRPTEEEACTSQYKFLRIDKMAYEIQDDMRKMAVSLVGTRDKIRRHPDVPFDAAPLIPGVQLDDVAIHFRCGDVLGGIKRNDFGMIRFNEYKKWIPNTTESIGIVTQPFDKVQNRSHSIAESQSRHRDAKNGESCRTVVHALIDYLQEFAPGATISIHNGRNETHPLAFARLVMAKISITSLSSFGIFPVVGTFGQGYFQRGQVNPFAAHIPSILPNIHVMDADLYLSGKMRGKSIESLVEWFVNNTDVA